MHPPQNETSCFMTTIDKALHIAYMGLIMAGIGLVMSVLGFSRTSPEISNENLRYQGPRLHLNVEIHKSDGTAM